MSSNSALRGGLIVVAGPSGAGKSTLLKRLLAEDQRFTFSVSATTRSPREGEEHGREYYFLGCADFDAKVVAGEFVEWEQLHANCYGTLKSEISRLRDLGQHVLLDLDVKGAVNVRNQLPDALLVFIEPPSLTILEQRLRDRQTDSDEQIAIRMKRVEMEMGFAGEFDQRIVNDDLGRAYQELTEVFLAHVTQA